MHSKAKPIALLENENAENRQERIDQIKGELEILEAEQVVYTASKIKPEENRTLSSPVITAAAAAPELSPSADPAGINDEVEAAPSTPPGPGAGSIAAPEHNPEAIVPPEKKKRGRPKGSKSKIK